MLLSLLPVSVHAEHSRSIGRYALIIANNSAEGEAEQLKTPEAEARELEHALKSRGLFDDDRVVAVIGGTQKEVKKGIEALLTIRKRDELEFGVRDTLLFVYFSGHSKDRLLLTAKGAVSADEIQDFIKDMEAKLTVGFIDACHAEMVAMKDGGARPLAFNPSKAFPDTLDAEGLVWVFSSTKGERTPEFEDVGGLLTHYFLESFEAVKPDAGIGASLIQMLKYTHNRTKAESVRRGHPQTPVLRFDGLKMEGEVYFSFPSKRSASVVLASDIEGEFIVSYQGQAGHAAHFVKARGITTRIRLFPGTAQLIPIINQAGSRTRADYRWDLNLMAGRTTSLSYENAKTWTDGLGMMVRYRSPSGVNAGVKARMGVEEDASNLQIGTGLSFTGIVESRLHPTRTLKGHVSWLTGSWSTRLSVGYGERQGSFPAWNYDVTGVPIQLEIGRRVWSRRGWRADLLVGGEYSINTLDYGQGVTRDANSYGGQFGSRLWWTPTRAPIAFSAKAAYSAIKAEGLAIIDTEGQWSSAVEVTLGVLFFL